MLALRDHNFSDLSEEVKLLVTKWLPDKDKLKLVKVLPPIVAQITTFGPFERKNLALQADSIVTFEGLKLVELFKKLTHIKRIVLPVEQNELNSLILSGQHNQDIEEFQKSGSWYEDDEVLEYIENVIKLGGTSKVKNIFDISNEKVIELVEKYPDLHLNLWLETHHKMWVQTHQTISESKLKKLIGSNERILNKIKVLHTTREFFDQLDPNIVFTSVQQLILFDSVNIIDDLRIVSRRAPNVSDLRVYFHRSLKNVKADDFIDQIFKFERLDTLDIIRNDEEEEDDETFMKIVNTLITSTSNPKLVNLSIKSRCKQFKIGEIFKLENMRKFKSLHLDPFRGSSVHFKNRALIVRDVTDVPLINILYKLNKIKDVEVETEDDEYFKKCQKDVENIYVTLPRNRNIQLYRLLWNSRSFEWDKIRSF